MLTLGCRHSGAPPDKASQEPHLLTGRTPFGAKLTDMNGVEGQLTNLESFPCQDRLCEGFQGFFQWTPSPYQGGWSGEVTSSHARLSQPRGEACSSWGGR